MVYVIEILAGSLLALVHDMAARRRGGAAYALRSMRSFPLRAITHAVCGLVFFGIVAWNASGRHASLVALAVYTVIGCAAQITTLIFVARRDRRHA